MKFFFWKCLYLHLFFYLFLNWLIFFQILCNFYPPLTTQVRAGVTNSLKQILDKRVIQNIEPLFDNPRMDPELKRLVRDTFPEFCSTTVHEEFPHGATPSATKMDLMAETGLDFPGSTTSGDVELNNHQPSLEEEAMFSDEEEESASSSSSRQNFKNRGISSSSLAPSYSSSTTITTTATTHHHHISTSLVSSIINSSNNSIISTSISKPVVTYSSNNNTINNINKYNTYSTTTTNSSGSNTINSSSKTTNNSSSNLLSDSIDLDTRNFSSNSGSKLVINGQNIVNGGSKGLRTSSSCNVFLSAEQLKKFNEFSEPLESDIREHLLDYKTQKDFAKKGESLQKICDLVVSEDLDDTEADNLAGAISVLLSSDQSLEAPLLPELINAE